MALAQQALSLPRLPRGPGMGRHTLEAALGVKLETGFKSRLCRYWPCDLGPTGGSLGLICEMGLLTLLPGVAVLGAHLWPWGSLSWATWMGRSTLLFPE